MATKRKSPDEGRAIVRTSLAEMERLHIRLQGSWRVFDKGLAADTGEVVYCARKIRKLIELIEREIVRERV